MKTASTLLLAGDVLMVRKELASLLGLIEAIVLQQLSYWLNEYARNPQHQYEGRTWVWNAINSQSGRSDWQENFPFWSSRTIERIFKKLRDRKIVLTERLRTGDNTLWYTIDFDRLETLADDASRQNDIPDKMTETLPDKMTETLTKTTFTKTTGEESPKPPPSKSPSKKKEKEFTEEAETVLQKLISASELPWKISALTVRPIRRLLRNGYSVEDCLTVIEKEVYRWHGQPFEVFRENLQPHILFQGSKFGARLHRPKEKERRSRKHRGKDDGTQAPVVGWGDLLDD